MTVLEQESPSEAHARGYAMAALLEGQETGRRTLVGGGVEHRDPGDFLSRLRLGGKRCHEQTQDECHKAPNGAVPHGRLLESVFC